MIDKKSPTPTKTQTTFGTPSGKPQRHNNHVTEGGIHPHDISSVWCMLGGPGKGAVSSVETTRPEAQRYIADWWRLGCSTDIRLWCHPPQCIRSYTRPEDQVRYWKLLLLLDDGGGRTAGYKRAYSKRWNVAWLLCLSTRAV